MTAEIIMTLPITLSQRQAYGINKRRQTYGSKPISFQAALRALRTSLFVQEQLFAIVEAKKVSIGTQNVLK